MDRGASTVSAQAWEAQSHVDSRPGLRADRLESGKTLGRYVIRKAIGEGGMGVVYAAYDPELDREVALKVVTPTNEDGATQRKRLLREARAAARLQHPNVVAIHDVGEVGESAYFAMELVRGRTLRHEVGDPSASFERRLGWLVDVARALAAAHRQGLVHRDIKPENVMVSTEGLVKVLDFGIARRADAPSDALRIGPDAVASYGVTGAGAVIGTPVYMAPEQIRNEPLDPRIDQFAWGVLAYELLSGKLPWTGRGASVFVEILSVEPPPPCRHDGGAVPAQVAAAIRRAMSKSPAERFPSMDELLAALTSEPAPWRPGVATQPLGRIALLLAAAALLVLVVRVVQLTRVHQPSSTVAPSTADTAAPPRTPPTSAGGVEANPGAVIGPAVAEPAAPAHATASAHAAVGHPGGAKPVASTSTQPSTVPSAPPSPEPSLDPLDIRK